MRHVVAAAILVVGAGAFAGGDVGAGGRGGVLLVVGHAFYCSAFPCIYTILLVHHFLGGNRFLSWSKIRDSPFKSYVLPV